MESLERPEVGRTHWNLVQEKANMKLNNIIVPEIKKKKKITGRTKLR